MGACYTVNFRLKVKNREKAAEDLLKWMAGKEQEGFCRFCLPGFEKEGVRPDSFDNITRIVLAGWKCTPFRMSLPDDGGFVTYENDFNASYGWELVLLDFAEALAPLLENGSTIYIEPDEDFHEFEVRDGRLTDMNP